MRIVTVYLKGDWARPGHYSGRNWDRGIVRAQTPAYLILQDNEYGLNSRTYPADNIARIEETGHW